MTSRDASSTLTGIEQGDTLYIDTAFYTRGVFEDIFESTRELTFFQNIIRR